MCLYRQKAGHSYELLAQRAIGPGPPHHVGRLHPTPALATAPVIEYLQRVWRRPVIMKTIDEHGADMEFTVPMAPTA